MDASAPVSAYVALGSNLGDRSGHLQAAVSALGATRGIEITAVSPVYENPARTASPDEVQPPYLNAVAAISTILDVHSLLERLLAIEVARGRTRDASTRWSARTLDLDLLLYGDRTIQEPSLVVPHPRMADRRFVLRPLADLAPNLRIPAPIDADLVDLLARCPDPVSLTAGSESLRIPGRGMYGQAEFWPETRAAPIQGETARPSEELRYVVIEGVIGVGKTTLAHALADRFRAQIVLEEFEENPFLARFYEDRPRWAFQTQLSFLASRYRQQQSLSRRDLFHDVTVSDYAFDKDRIFARINLSGDELHLYETMFAIMQPSVPRPDLIVYLQASTDRIMDRIRRRGRAFEANMDQAYIESLNEAYNAYFFHYTLSPLLIVNASRLDFVKNSADLDELLLQIARIQRPGTTYFNPAGPA